MFTDQGEFPSWDAVAAELRACREQQKQTWGEVDDALIGRYLAGEVTAEERQQVEASLEAHPELRILTEIVSDVLAGCSPAVEAAAPLILPFAQARPRARSRFHRYQKHLALAAAACLLLGLGLALEQHQASDPNADAPFAESSLAANGRSGRQFFKTSVMPLGQEETQVALANELIEKGQIDGAAQTLFADSKSAGPQPAPRSVPRGRKLNHTVVRLAERVLDKMPHHENGFKKVETISMAFDPPAGRPAFAPAIVPDQRAEQRREWILSHSLPYLIDGVEQRDDPELQRASANTLARMGPYATPAVPQLAEALRKSDCPMQQSNLVEVFKQLGPDARPASADLENFADHCRKEVQPLARQALAAMHMPKWIGVRDMGHVLDDKARQRLDQRIHELSRRYHVHIVAETVRTMPAAARNVYSTFKPAEQAAYLTKFAQDRCQQLGADRGVYLFVCMDPPAIQVALGSETQSRHIPGWSPDAAKDSIDKTMKSRDYDKGLEEVVQMIEQAIKK